MTPVTCFSGKSVALFGLGGSGLATALALVAGGASVAVWDDSEEARLKAAERGLAVVDLSSLSWSRFDSFILSPGVPLTHPKPHWTVEKAKAAGIEIIGDIELFCRERAQIAPKAPFIAITGTNGKSTTTALIAHLLRQAGKDVQMGGNIGTAILSLDPPADDRFHVVECSTFQIDLAPSLAPSVGVLLNITPDHLDRHGTMENYIRLKTSLPCRSDFSVLGVDDEYFGYSLDALNMCGIPTVKISSESIPLKTLLADDLARSEGIFLNGTKLFRVTVKYDAYDAYIREAPSIADQTSPAESFPFAETAEIVDLAGIGTLRGAHNAQNAAAAVAATREVGLSDAEIREGLKTFPGLAHRMEQVGRLGPVLFVNDSKATNADAAEKALLSFPDGIFWIAGGVQKEGGIAPLEPHFGRVAKAYLIGKSSDDFGATLAGKVSYVRCGTLDKAVEMAAKDAALSAAKEPVVLLSPACASYDQYRNFELRGAHFRDLVRALPGVMMTTSPEADLNAFTR